MSDGYRGWLQRLAVVLLVAVIARFPAAGDEIDLVRPIALAISSEGHVVLLHRHGGLYRADPEKRRLWKVEESSGPWRPLDMSLVSEGGRDYAYVTEHWPVHRDRSLHRLARYDATTGKLVDEWQASLPLSTGVAVSHEPPATAYLAANVESEVLRLDLTREMATPDRLARLWYAGRLGAIFLDPVDRRLWVADTGRSVVLSVELDGTAGPVVRGNLTLPVALSVDPRRRRLFILDNVERRLFVVDLTSDTPRAETFADLDGARDPLGLAVDDTSGTVWVGDAGNGRLLSFDAQGRFLRWLSLPMPEGR